MYGGRDAGLNAVELTELEKANYKSMSYDQLLRVNVSFHDVDVRKEHLAFIKNELRIKRSVQAIRGRGYPHH